MINLSGQGLKRNRKSPRFGGSLLAGKARRTREKRQGEARCPRDAVQRGPEGERRRGRSAGAEVAHRALAGHRLDLNCVSIWVPAPESNPSDVKGEGSRKNNMEITWTVSVAPAQPGGRRRASGPPSRVPWHKGHRVAQPPGCSAATLLCTEHPETKRGCVETRVRTGGEQR